MIDTAILRSTSRLYKLSDLVENLDLNVPERAEQHIRGAFLCLHRIPNEAIIGSRNPAEVEIGKFCFTSSHGLTSGQW